MASRDGARFLHPRIRASAKQAKVLVPTRCQRRICRGRLQASGGALGMTGADQIDGPQERSDCPPGGDRWITGALLPTPMKPCATLAAERDRTTWQNRWLCATPQSAFAGDSMWSADPNRSMSRSASAGFSTAEAAIWAATILVKLRRRSSGLFDSLRNKACASLGSGPRNHDCN